MKMQKRGIAVTLALALMVGFGVFFVFSEAEDDILELVVGEEAWIPLEVRSDLSDIPVEELAEVVGFDTADEFHRLFEYRFDRNAFGTYLVLTPNSVSAKTEFSLELIFFSWEEDVDVDIDNLLLDGDISQPYREILFGDPTADPTEDDGDGENDGMAVVPQNETIMPAGIGTKIIGFEDTFTAYPGSITDAVTNSYDAFSLLPAWFKFNDTEKPEPITAAILGASTYTLDCTLVSGTGMYSAALDPDGVSVRLTVASPPTSGTDIVTVMMKVTDGSSLTERTIASYTITPAATEPANIFQDYKHTNTSTKNISNTETIKIPLTNNMFTSGSASTSADSVNARTDNEKVSARVEGTDVIVTPRTNIYGDTIEDVRVYLEEIDNTGNMLDIGEFTIHHAPVTGVAKGFKENTYRYSDPVAITQGGYTSLAFFIPINSASVTGSNILTLDGTPKYTSRDDLVSSGISLSVNNSNFSVSIENNSYGFAVLRITANASATPQLYNDLQITMTKSGYQGTSFNSSVITFTNFTVNSTISPNTVRINGIDSSASLGQTSNGIFGGIAIEDDSGVDESGNNLTDLDLEVGDEIRIYFDTDTFTWEGGVKPAPAVPLTSTILNRSLSTISTTATLRIGNRSSSSTSITPTIKYVNNQYSYISLTIPATELTYTNNNFELTVNLNYGNRTGSSSTNRATVTLKGTLYNRVIEVYNSHGYIDTSNGEIFEAMESVSNIEIYAGNGVTLFVSRLNRNKQYRAYTHTDPDSADDDVMDKYSDITEVIHLVTSGGLNTSATTVAMDIPSSYHVYNKNLEYLGTGSDLNKLPYSTVYYIATRKLDLGEEESSSSAVAGANNNTGDVVETPNPATPGGTTAAGNGNYNPGTGC